MNSLRRPKPMAFNRFGLVPVHRHVMVSIALNQPLEFSNLVCLRDFWGHQVFNLTHQDASPKGQ